jgi:peptidoglycan/LPS O-acetylase OafA/YrhL
MLRASAVQPPATLERLHLAHVEGLRAVAALVVFVNHAYAHSGFPGHDPGAPWYLRFFMHFMVAGHLSVSVFIVISGFCLTLPVVDAGDRIANGVLQFIKRRARRILPPYYAALALSLLMILTIIGTPTGSPWDVPIEFGARDVLIHLLLLQDFFSTGKINYVFWSIAVEWQIYFLFPLLVLATRRYGVLAVTVLALLVGYAVRIAGDGTRVERANPHFLGLFALGMLAAYFVRAPRFADARLRLLPLVRWIGLACFAGVCLALGYLSERGPHYFAQLDLPVGVMAFAILVHTTLRQGSASARFLNQRWVVWMGTFSYSIYLVHAPLLQALWQYAVRPLGLSKAQTLLVLCTAGAAFVILASYAFFWVCERPFMRAQRRVQATPEPASATS